MCVPHITTLLLEFLSAGVSSLGFMATLGRWEEPSRMNGIVRIIPIQFWLLELDKRRVSARR